MIRWTSRANLRNWAASLHHERRSGGCRNSGRRQRLRKVTKTGLIPAFPTCAYNGGVAGQRRDVDAHPSFTWPAAGAWKDGSDGRRSRRPGTTARGEALSNGVDPSAALSGSRPNARLRHNGAQRESQSADRDRNRRARVPKQQPAAVARPPFHRLPSRHLRPVAPSQGSLRGADGACLRPGTDQHGS